LFSRQHKACPNPKAYPNTFVSATPVSSLPFVLIVYIQLNNQSAAISGGRLRSARRKKFSIAGAFSAQVDNGERLRESAEVF
jgi:hypothetical protein